MAKDYKNTSRPRSKAKPPKPTPGWVWMLGGLLIGLLVALLVYLRDDLQTGSERTTPIPVEEKSQPAPKQATINDEPREQTDKKPRFDFYNLLPEMEVFIPPQELATERERKTVDSIAYYLQVGSFRRMEDADRMRAQLALNNIESHIQRVTINDSQTWYRVRVGPFQSARKMDIVRNRLRAQSMDPIVLKVK